MIKITELDTSAHDYSEDVAALYKFAGWGDISDAPSIKVALTNSYCAYGAFDGEKLVGFFRALCDGVSDAFLLDMVVNPDYRNRGIAHNLTEVITARLKSEGISWITCISEPEAADIYIKTGTIMKGYTPFRFM